ncbi:MAG: hypothetical protein ABIJ15_08410 [bacterium]
MRAELFRRLPVAPVKNLIGKIAIIKKSGSSPPPVPFQKFSPNK